MTQTITSVYSNTVTLDSGNGYSVSVLSGGAIEAGAAAAGIYGAIGGLVLNDGLVKAGAGQNTPGNGVQGGIGTDLVQASSVTNCGTIDGGAGAKFGTNAVVNGGGGGAGILLSGGSVINDGTVSAGGGGAGPNGGKGGDGIDVVETNFITNQGEIDGGSGGGGLYGNGGAGGIGIDATQGAEAVTAIDRTLICDGTSAGVKPEAAANSVPPPSSLRSCWARVSK